MKTMITFLMAAIICMEGLSQKKNLAIEPLNIDYMNSGYFYAACPQIKKTMGFGGWGTSKNMFMKTEDEIFEKGILSVEVKTENKRVFAEKYAGFSAYVVNMTADTVFFDAQDSRLQMVLQALTKKGEWMDIEYLPSSWCGNSYHQVYLPGNHYWEFAIPQYEGTMKTRLRAALNVSGSPENPASTRIYSNEFEGSINPGQFTNKPGYKANGLMDPYDD